MNDRRPVYWDFATGEIKEFGNNDRIHPDHGGGGGDFVELGDVPTSYASQGGKYVRVNTGETGLEFVNPPSGSGDVTGPASSTNNNIALFDGVTGKAIKDSGVALSSKADATHTHAISDVTNLQTSLDGKAASSHTHAISDTTGLQTALDGKAASTHTHAISDTTGLQTALDGKESLSNKATTWDITNDTLYPTTLLVSDSLADKVTKNTAITGATKTKITYDSKGLVTAGADLAATDLPTGIDASKIADGTVSNAEFQTLNGVTSAIQTQLDGKQDTLTNGFGLTGTTTKAVALTTAEAFCTAETTLSASAYADITGASITLAAGTWVILATINGSSQSTTATVLNAAITTAANAIVAEGAQHIVAGTATVRTWGNIQLSAIVSPSGSTTYKLRGARGTTTQTGNCIVSDGTGVATANNVSNNSDKSTSIRAFRIA